MTRTRLRALALAFVVLAGMPLAGVGVAPAAADEDGPPVPPASYYGDVTLDGDPAPAGVEVAAYVDGEQRGTLTTDEAGQYGGASALAAKLQVDGSQDDHGATVEFTINGEPADATVEWESGDVTEVDLAAGDGSAGDDPVDEPGDDPNDEPSDGPNDGADDGPADGPNDGADDGPSDGPNDGADDGPADDPNDGGNSAAGGSDGNAAAAGGAPVESAAVTAEVEATDEGAVVSATDVEPGATVEADLDDAASTDVVSVDGLELTVADATDEVAVETRLHEQRPANVSEPDAEPASYVEFTTDDPVESATVAFSADLDAVDDPDDVALFRYADDGWNELPTAHHGGGEFSAETPGFSVFAVGTQQSAIDVTAADVGVDAVDPGEFAEVTATVANDGASDGTATVVLTVDGEIADTRELTVPADEEREITFTPRFDEPAEYDIAVDSLDAGTLTVTDPATETPDEPPATEDESEGTDESASVAEPFGVGLEPLVGLLAVVLVVVGAFLVRRR